MQYGKKTLGVLGGLGPMSSVYFYEMLTSHTKAERDSDHLNIFLSSRADTPDRTDFILGRSADNPLPVMQTEIGRLYNAGADVIAIPCNTAHYFYDALSASVCVPVINIIRQTALFCHRQGFSRVGVLATEGTVASGAYKSVLALAGIDCVSPSESAQAALTDIIYRQIKSGRAVDLESFLAVCGELLDGGCERLLLGCTELSLIKRDGLLCGQEERFIDSLEVLAYSSIRMCGAEPCGFDGSLMKFKV